MLEPLSIIVPCLNEEYYIGHLLDSLAAQTFQDFEIIIVDGNSTDDTRGSVAHAVARNSELTNKVRFIAAQKRGISYQRNLGVSLARYEHLLFLDADVQFEPSFLTETLHEIQERGLSLASVDFEPLSHRLDDKILYALGNLYVQLRQFIQPVAMGFCIFSNKEVHAAIRGFSERMRMSEDYDYVMRAAKYGASLRILAHGKIYMSVRRLEEEGRFTYYFHKAFLSQVYQILNISSDYTERIEYVFGEFGPNTEISYVELNNKKSWWKQLIHLFDRIDTNKV